MYKLYLYKKINHTIQKTVFIPARFNSSWIGATSPSMLKRESIMPSFTTRLLKTESITTTKESR
jgi:hypothetical protein